ncbi:hypothetical protein CEXT_242961 [Caerostris extrusa]|uniref:Uncharacterized protein n=1 Tax=Caerostris extrusa TaxID=172846 RepID=A0AAV4MUM1_CAEEX|nr:hypothetical protein CEXT_242961 [Caerostris extrusa]
MIKSPPAIPLGNSQKVISAIIIIFSILLCFEASPHFIMALRANKFTRFRRHYKSLNHSSDEFEPAHMVADPDFKTISIAVSEWDEFRSFVLIVYRRLLLFLPLSIKGAGIDHKRPGKVVIYFRFVETEESFMGGVYCSPCEPAYGKKLRAAV